MQEAEQLVIDAINVGLSAMHKVPEEGLKEAVLDFIKKYGFLDFMTALPTTAYHEQSKHPLKNPVFPDRDLFLLHLLRNIFPASSVRNG